MVILLLKIMAKHYWNRSKTQI